MTRAEMLKTLDMLKDELRQKYKVKRLGLFGSFIREEQKESSDIDVLVTFTETADLFDMIGLALFLEEKLKRKVDVVPEQALREELKESVLKEVAYI